MYELSLASEVTAAIGELPAPALVSLAELFALLEIAPWGGDPHNDDKPDGAMRHRVFGPGGLGDLVYVILESTRRVELVRLVWLGD